MRLTGVKKSPVYKWTFRVGPVTVVVRASTREEAADKVRDAAGFYGAIQLDAVEEV